MGASAGWQDFEPKQQGWQDFGSENPASKETEFEKERAPDKRQGGWRALGSDLLGFLKPTAQNPYPGMGVEAKQEAAKQSATDDARRKSAGYSPAYRAVAPVAQSAGLNVNGMEHAAEVGDEAGVWGHAAAPAVAYGVTRGTGAAANSRAGRAAGAGIGRGAKAAMPEFISRPVREGLAGARESWQASAPKRGMDAMSAAVPPEVDALSEAASKASPPPVESSTAVPQGLSKRLTSRAELNNDLAVRESIEDEFNREGRNATRDASREWYDRNSPSVPKWKQVAQIRAQLAAEAVMKEAEAAQQIPARMTKTRPPRSEQARSLSDVPPATGEEDLLPKLEESLRQARAKKGQPKGGK